MCALEKIRITSRILELGGIKINERNLEDTVKKIAEDSKKDDDTTGGIIEVSIDNLPPRDKGAPLAMPPRSANWLNHLDHMACSPSYTLPYEQAYERHH